MAFLYRPWHAKNKWKGHLWASCCPGPGLRGYLCRARPPLPACLRDACDGRCRPPRCSPRHVQSKTHKTRWRRTSLLKLRGPRPLNFCSAICLRVSLSQRSLVTHRLGLWNAKAFPFCFSITIGPGTEDTGSREDVLLAAGGGGGAWHVPNRLFAESMPFFQCPTPLDTRAALPTAVPGQLDANRPQGSPPLQGLRALALGVALR